ncbi:MAG: hypothetical protein LKJ25_04160 [Clostridia bacterium]|jgi:hypothetical protein|nr:hypothetical protein [Clostridia bacterium]
MNRQIKAGFSLPYKLSSKVILPNSNYWGEAYQSLVQAFLKACRVGGTESCWFSLLSSAFLKGWGSFLQVKKLP